MFSYGLMKGKIKLQLAQATAVLFIWESGNKKILADSISGFNIVFLHNPDQDP